MLELLSIVVALLGAAVLGLWWLGVHGFLDRGLPGLRRKDQQRVEEAGRRKWDDS